MKGSWVECVEVFMRLALASRATKLADRNYAMNMNSSMSEFKRIRNMLGKDVRVDDLFISRGILAKDL